LKVKIYILKKKSGNKASMMMIK